MSFTLWEELFEIHRMIVVPVQGCVHDMVLAKVLDNVVDMVWVEFKVLTGTIWESDDAIEIPPGLHHRESYGRVVSDSHDHHNILKKHAIKLTELDIEKGVGVSETERIHVCEWSDN